MLAAALAVSTSPSAEKTLHFTCSGKQITLFDNTNGNPVVNGALPPTLTTNGRAYCLTYIQTYHWNGGKGQPPGSLGLRRTGGPAGFQAVVGPFPAKASAGQNNAPNVNWYVGVPPIPATTVLDGTYSCSDSGSASWSTNAPGGPGFCIVYAVPAQTNSCSIPAGAANPPPRPCADLAISDEIVGGFSQWANLSTLLAHAKQMSASARAALLQKLRALGGVKAVGASSWVLEDVTIANNGDDPGSCTYTLRPGGTYNCSAKPIAPGQAVSYFWWWRPVSAGTYSRSAVIASATVSDPEPTNNASTMTFLNSGAVSNAVATSASRRGFGGSTRPTQADSSRPAPVATFTGGGGIKAGPPTLASTAGGSSTRVDHVELALVRLSTGTTLTGSVIHAPSCSWLTGPNGAFTAIASLSGVCLDYTWLRAQGTSHWTYPLTQPLPTGRYALYVRALDAAGASSGEFNAADHTLVVFTIS